MSFKKVSYVKVVLAGKRLFIKIFNLLSSIYENLDDNFFRNCPKRYQKLLRFSAIFCQFILRYCGRKLIFYIFYDIIKEKWLFCRRNGRFCMPFGAKVILHHILGRSPRYIFIKKSNKIAKKRPVCHDFLEKRTSFHLTIFLFHRWAPGSNRDDKKWKGISPEKRTFIAGRLMRPWLKI